MTKDQAIMYLRSMQGICSPQDRMAKEAVKMATEALSAEAVQGEWVRKYDDKVNCYWYECDQCGEYRPRNQFGHEYNANFCPNCGARMLNGGEQDGNV